MKQRIAILYILIMILVSGCAANDFSSTEDKSETTQQSEDSTAESYTEGLEDNAASVEGPRESNLAISGYQERIPCEYQYKEGDHRNNRSNSIYDKNYNDYQGIGMYTMEIRTPDIDLKENLDDYFIPDGNFVQRMEPLTSIVYDNRTIEMSEEDLKALFYRHGFYLYLHNADIEGVHIRLWELQEIDGLSLYPSRILMQTWYDSSIFAEDITGPIPRKIRTLFPVEGGAEPKLIIHSSGLSVDYISEEELSFWTFVGTGWVLSEMDLEIDTTHAYNAGEYYAEINKVNKDELFPVTFYSDGIAYRPSRQDEYGGKRSATDTFRLGKLEVIEKNKIFRLVAIFEILGVTEPAIGDCYIEFTVK